MKPLIYLSIMRGIGYLLVITLCMNCKKDIYSQQFHQSLLFLSLF